MKARYCVGIEISIGVAVVDGILLSVAAESEQHAISLNWVSGSANFSILGRTIVDAFRLEHLGVSRHQPFGVKLKVVSCVKPSIITEIQNIGVPGHDTNLESFVGFMNLAIANSLNDSNDGASEHSVCQKSGANLVMRSELKSMRSNGVDPMRSRDINAVRNTTPFVARARFLCGDVVSETVRIRFKAKDSQNARWLCWSPGSARFSESDRETVAAFMSQLGSCYSASEIRIELTRVSDLRQGTKDGQHTGIPGRVKGVDSFKGFVNRAISNTRIYLGYPVGANEPESAMKGSETGRHSLAPHDFVKVNEFSSETSSLGAAAAKHRAETRSSISFKEESVYPEKSFETSEKQKLNLSFEKFQKITLRAISQSMGIPMNLIAPQRDILNKYEESELKKSITSEKVLTPEDRYDWASAAKRWRAKAAVFIPLASWARENKPERYTTGDLAMLARDSSKPSEREIAYAAKEALASAARACKAPGDTKVANGLMWEHDFDTKARYRGGC